MGEICKIELTYSEAELFKKFRQYQNVWINVFKVKGGSVMLHFDEKGDIRKVEYKYQEKLDKDKGFVKA